MLSRLKAIGAVALALCLGGCLTPPDFDNGPTIHSRIVETHQTATVWFMTTRCNDTVASGTDLGPESRETLLYKRCWDALPNTPSAREILNTQFGIAEGDRANCGTAVIDVAGRSDREPITTVTDIKKRSCDDLVREVLNNGQCRRALIFVHGYNTTLPYALRRRTGQLAVDLGDNSQVPILFSFGAAGRVGDYVNDIEAAELAAPALHDKLLVPLSPCKPDMIAHSMGTRVALRAITEGSAPKVRYMIAAAPDIDPAAFLRLADRALNADPQRVEHLTVYTSEYDTALAGSIYQHNGRDRIGHGLTAKVGDSVRNADVIDASNEATTGYGHSYFAESERVLKDIKAALNGVRADDPSREIRRDKDNRPAIPCQSGDSCSPSLYESFVKWITRLAF